VSSARSPPAAAPWGLILDGVLTQYFSWRWTLYVNLPFAAIAIAGALVFIHSSRPAVAACRWKFRFPAQRPHLPVAGNDRGTATCAKRTLTHRQVKETHMTTTAFMTAVVTTATAQGSCLGTRFALKVS
jgi:MFS family permease